jgi:hypothetical protein
LHSLVRGSSSIACLPTFLELECGRSRTVAGTAPHGTVFRRDSDERHILRPRGRRADGLGHLHGVPGAPRAASPDERAAFLTTCSEPATARSRSCSRRPPPAYSVPSGRGEPSGQKHPQPLVRTCESALALATQQGERR